LRFVLTAPNHPPGSLVGKDDPQSRAKTLAASISAHRSLLAMRIIFPVSVQQQQQLAVAIAGFASASDRFSSPLGIFHFPPNRRQFYFCCFMSTQIENGISFYGL